MCYNVKIGFCCESFLCWPKSEQFDHISILTLQAEMMIAYLTYPSLITWLSSHWTPVWPHLGTSLVVSKLAYLVSLFWVHIYALNPVRNPCECTQTIPSHCEKLTKRNWDAQRQKNWILMGTTLFPEAQLWQKEPFPHNRHAWFDLAVFAEILGKILGYFSELNSWKLKRRDSH